MADDIRVAVIDHYPLFRKGVVQAINRTKGMAAVAEKETAQAAIDLANAGAVDVILMEAAVPRSIEATRKITQSHPETKVVFLASVEDDDLASQALHAGAHGYIMKGITGRDLAAAIKSVQAGERYLTPQVAFRLVAQPKPSPVHQAHPKAMDKPLLTAREQKVLDHAARGLTNREIASMLGLGLSTIKYCKTRLFRKMGIRNRLEALVALNAQCETDKA